MVTTNECVESLPVYYFGLFAIGRRVQLMLNERPAVLVLGHRGMLGHMVQGYLQKSESFNVAVLAGRFSDWSSSDFDSFDYVVNCVGAIPQKTAQFEINYELPEWLEANTDCRIIHPSTDCEIDDDPYGISKRRANRFILESAANSKIIKTSIIGPELSGDKASLLEWFLRQSGEVSGYTEAIWNGVTTLEWARFCTQILADWESFPVQTIIGTQPVTKYELLQTIASVYEKTDVVIKRVAKGKDKSLIADLYLDNIDVQLQRLREWT